ncbi:hypothetical protein [Mesorhizobium sanjuanii]|nr:hypothetical protein [Mesorhizobium sanjuanii]
MDEKMWQSPYVNTGNGLGTALAVLVVGLMAIGVVFLILGGALYLDQGTDERSLSTIPARAVVTQGSSPAR